MVINHMEAQVQTRVFLKSIQNDKGPFVADSGKVTARFRIYHDNDSTVVEQDLVLTGHPEGWGAEMRMDDFPLQKTAGDAVLKLADWMERLAVTLRAGQFEKHDINCL